MTTEALNSLVAGKEYDFLRTNEHLKDRIMFLTLGGSHAYGTNVEGSDVDVRGCALNSKSDILGLSNFEQVVDKRTDTVVYSFKKLVNLLLNCNPNTIELLGCKPEHYFVLSPAGREMIDNRKLFLSQRAVNAFGGYANQQLRRLENAIARDALPQARREEHMRTAIETALTNWDQRDSVVRIPDDSIRLFTDSSEREDLDREVFVDISLTHYPARQLRSIINNMSNVIGNYEKLNHRNRKDEGHLNKHAMHLVRLYLMCLDILEKEEICTYREKDRNFLLEIRNGKFMREDGTYDTEFFQLVNDLEKRLEYAKRNTSLPKDPDHKRVEEFVMDINRQAIL